MEGHRLRELRAISQRSGDASVEATIGTSYHALPPRLRFAFLSLCEFPGSFDEAAAASLLCGAEHPRGIMAGADQSETALQLGAESRETSPRLDSGLFSGLYKLKIPRLIVGGGLS